MSMNTSNAMPTERNVRFQTDSVWNPPTKSQSSRSISFRGRFSDRGTITAGGRTYMSESGMEADVCAILLTRPDVAHVREQPPAVLYTKSSGAIGRHTFDFLVTLLDDRRIAIQVKPLKRTRKPGFVAGMARIAAQMPPDFAYQAVVVTEANYSRAEADSARMLLAARMRPIAAFDTLIESAIGTINGAVSIAGLMRIAGAPGEGFRAVVRAIDRGLLEIRSPGRISSQTLVAPTSGGSV